MSDLYDLELRVKAIEARQRAAQIHDPWCPEVLLTRAKPVSMLYVDPNVCCCWLSEPAT